MKKIELYYSNWTQLKDDQNGLKASNNPPTTVHLHGSQEPLLIAAKRVNVSSGHSGDLGIHSALQYCWTQQHPTPPKPTHNMVRCKDEPTTTQDTYIWTTYTDS